MCVAAYSGRWCVVSLAACLSSHWLRWACAACRCRRPQSIRVCVARVASRCLSGECCSPHRIMWLLMLVTSFADLPVVVPMPAQVYLPRGMTGRLTCDVTANPAATLVVWTRNEGAIDQSDGRLKVAADGALVIRSVETADAGRYTCTPYSPLGTGTSSRPVQLIVRGTVTELSLTEQSLTEMSFAELSLTELALTELSLTEM